MTTSTIKVGDTIPKGEFAWIQYTPELEDNSACGLPTTLSTDEWKGKKVVLFAVPGAFTVRFVSAFPSMGANII